MSRRKKYTLVCWEKSIKSFTGLLKVALAFFYFILPVSALAQEISSPPAAAVMDMSKDMDNDGLPDWWEIRFSGVLNISAADSDQDPDKDGLSNHEEFLYGTHPDTSDTDADGLSDSAEIHQYETNPVIADTDMGGRSDGYEVNNQRNPLNPDDDDAVLTSFSISLQEGWNLISLPLTPAVQAITSILAPLSGMYSAIWAYKEGQWLFYNPDMPAMSDLKNMQPGWGYWIKMKQSATLIISGSSPSDQISLTAGWNLIGYNSTADQNASSVLEPIDGKYVNVWSFIDNVWKVYDPENSMFSDLKKFSPGYGYWINIKMACDWYLP